MPDQEFVLGHAPALMTLKHSNPLYNFDCGDQRVLRVGSTLFGDAPVSADQKNNDDPFLRRVITPSEHSKAHTWSPLNSRSPNQSLTTPVGSMSSYSPVDWRFEDLVYEKVIGILKFIHQLLLTSKGIGTYGTVVTVRNKHFTEETETSHHNAPFRRSPFDITCVVKMVKKRKIIETNQFEHITAEKNVLISLDHPFIVKLYD
jgi:hypothetical protein